MGEGSSSSSVDKTLKLNFLEKKISGNSYISKLCIVQGAPPKYLAAKKCFIAKGTVPQDRTINQSNPGYSPLL